MLLVGLTGGLGSGKSTVARMLASKGAIVLDADEFAKEAVDVGTAGLKQVVFRFGPAVVQSGSSTAPPWPPSCSPMREPDAISRRSFIPPSGA